MRATLVALAATLTLCVPASAIALHHAHHRCDTRCQPSPVDRPPRAEAAATLKSAIDHGVLAADFQADAILRPLVARVKSGLGKAKLVEHVAGTASALAQPGGQKPTSTAVRVRMYDSVTVSAIPSTAYAVAGYVGGSWRTFPTLERDFPRARKLSIAVNARENAECLDIENGDASPAEAPAWVKRQLRRGVGRPVVYASYSVMPKVIRALTNAGIRRSEYRVWTAHYVGYATIDPGADATQYSDSALGRNLDASLYRRAFFNSTALPAPAAHSPSLASR